MDNVVFSPWYLNTNRLAVITNSDIGFEAQSSLNQNSGERARAMRDAARIANTVLKSGQLPNLTKMLVDNGVPLTPVTAALWGIFTFRGVSKALMNEADGKNVTPASFSATIVMGTQEFKLSGTLHNSHFYSDSSAGYLSGTKRVLVVGQFSFAEANVDVRPLLIGELATDFSSISKLPYGWPTHSRIYPQTLDCFEKISGRRAPTKKQVERLLDISEEMVKQSFAKVIGEPFVPKDWGGEKSDLQTSRITIGGKSISAAFIFKGPSVPGELHPANMGKRGDQLVRAFDEPVDLVVIQHCNKIANSVVRQAEALATDASKPKAYCIIDGADTYSILKAYGKI